MKNKLFQLHLSAMIMVVVLSLCFTSCSKDDDEEYAKSELLGVWTMNGQVSDKLLVISSSSCAMYSILFDEGYIAVPIWSESYNLSWDKQVKRYEMWYEPTTDVSKETPFLYLTLTGNLLELTIVDNKATFLGTPTSWKKLDDIDLLHLLDRLNNK